MTHHRSTMESGPASVSPRVADLALDLRKGFPRSPRAKLGDYVIAARTLDKCRAILLGQEGEYNFGGLLDRCFLEFVGITADDFKAQVATGASDADMIRWINEHARSRPPEEIVAWNNKMRELRLSDLPPRAQMFMEGYIPTHVPAGRVPYVWFDVYDLEEGRI